MSLSAEPYLYPPRQAYDLAATEYDQWPWQAVWRHTEAPLVLSWLGIGGGRRLLDLGAGTGSYLRHLVGAGFHGTGLDISDAMLRVAAQRLHGSAMLVLGDARCLPFKRAGFDQILATRVLSHIDDVATVFREARRVLAQGGDLVISDLDPAHDYSNTELPLLGRKIAVTTYKHSLTSLAAMAEANGGFTLSRRAVIRGCDLALPNDIQQLSSVDVSSTRPIAFIAQFTTADH
jgi:ubiquinone/menaquinone biosynthesis C-methylase UbiE